jgi:hypothetical protein
MLPPPILSDISPQSPSLPAPNCGHGYVYAPPCAARLGGPERWQAVVHDMAALNIGGCPYCRGPSANRGRMHCHCSNVY